MDILAVEPGHPRTLVFVEVRSHTTSRFGAPEESVDRRKVTRVYRAAGALRALGTLPDGRPLPRLPWRVDLLAVDERPRLARGIGGPTVRHVRALERS